MAEVLDEMLGRMTIEESWYASIRGTSPWAFSSAATPSPRLIVVTSGECVFTSDALPEPMTLVAGDCVIVQAGVDVVLQDDLSTEPVDCNGLSFDDRQQASLSGGGAVTEMHTGRFGLDVDASELLMGLLPPVMRIGLDEQAGSSIRATLQILSLESANSLGGGAMRGRLADILFLQVLRAWCESSSEIHVGWIAALRVPQLTSALTAMHQDLAHPWTVAELARLSLMSRSSFAALFKSVTGDSPLAYLTRWRVYRAKTLLRDSGMSILEVALAVGYESDTALSRAFRRTEQVAPGVWRRRQVNGSRAA
ncbi:AraC family transcriptional regulator [Mycobacterium sp. URHB0044]|uniref:AraC family transcriptional regulator n=1 Tax=Mycobacterium sp. URHB0044 TaxID=1380386 RepID=UPI000687E3A0|nr:AraC family transcriptional regulator [Mycobacterium sp. URHB0044]